MTEALYRLKKVVMRYGVREACHIESLEIYRGEILGIIGPSGAGKSTLLRLLNFLESPTSGKIVFEGTRYNGTSSVPLSIRRRMTLVFQNPLLLNNSSVLTNVAYSLKLRGEKGAKDRARETLKQFGMENLMKQPPYTLSYGELQRVALARAMIINPQVLLLDEPTANLDPYNVSLIEKMVRKANRELHSTVVIVTHNVFQARRVADRVAFLLDGRVIEIGPTEKIFSEAEDQRTRAFVNGEMVY